MCVCVFVLGCDRLNENEWSGPSFVSGNNHSRPPSPDDSPSTTEPSMVVVDRDLLVQLCAFKFIYLFSCVCIYIETLHVEMNDLKGSIDRMHTLGVMVETEQGENGENEHVPSTINQLSIVLFCVGYKVSNWQVRGRVYVCVREQLLQCTPPARELHFTFQGYNKKLCGEMEHQRQRTICMSIINIEHPEEPWILFIH